MPNPSRETKFSGTNADREIFIFPVQLTTCRTGNLIRLIHTLAICVTIHTYTCTTALAVSFEESSLTAVQVFEIYILVLSISVSFEESSLTAVQVRRR